MKEYRFYKKDNLWFIDLKCFPFNKKWLEMVMGADELLDKIAKGKDEVRLNIDTTPIAYSDGNLVRTYKKGLFNGAYYEAKPGYSNIKEYKQCSVWLCPVTLMVFLKYPKKIYYKIVKDE